MKQRHPDVFKTRRNLEKGCELYDNGNHRQAAKYYAAAAKAGSAEAQVNLANMLESGDGIPQNIPKAIYWYKKAIKSGCCYGASGLAVLYRNRQQARWAKYWFKKAYQMGDEWALEELTHQSPISR